MNKQRHILIKFYLDEAGKHRIIFQREILTDKEDGKLIEESTRLTSALYDLTYGASANPKEAAKRLIIEGYEIISKDESKLSFYTTTHCGA